MPVRRSLVRVIAMVLDPFPVRASRSFRETGSVAVSSALRIASSVFVDDLRFRGTTLWLSPVTRYRNEGAPLPSSFLLPATSIRPASRSAFTAFPRVLRLLPLSLTISRLDKGWSLSRRAFKMASSVRSFARFRLGFLPLFLPCLPCFVITNGDFFRFAFFLLGLEIRYREDHLPLAPA